MTKTLLVDGNNLFKIGFHGAKELFYDGNHIGGVYHFINILRKFLEEHNHDKVIVMWDGESNSVARKLIYPQYKANRFQTGSDESYESYLKQRERVKQYLEEVFVRQIEVDDNEADDLIAYYCQIAKEEKIIIFSADKDLTQLISENVTIYSPISKTYFKHIHSTRYELYNYFKNLVFVKSLCQQFGIELFFVNNFNQQNMLFKLLSDFYSLIILNSYNN